MRIMNLIQRRFGVHIQYKRNNYLLLSIPITAKPARRTHRGAKVNTPPPRPSAQLNRTQVHTALAKLQLSPAVRSLANRLLQLMDAGGGASVKAVHANLFPIASTASAASAQLSNLLKAISSAGEKSRVTIKHAYEGEKNAEVAARKLVFVGPRSISQADTEGLNAIPRAQLVSGQEGLPVVTEKCVVLLTFNEHELLAVLRAFLPPDAHPRLSNEGGIAVYRLGQHGGMHVLLHHSAQGNRQSQRTTTELRTALQPLAVVAVGIAFGIDDTQQSVGDVLISKFVCDCEPSKVHKSGHISLRGARPPASRRWVQALRPCFEGGDSQSQCRTTQPSPLARPC